MSEVDPEDVLVTIGHPYGDLEVSLIDWMRLGPGQRPGVRPLRARSRSTGEALPLDVVPLRYRNTSKTRRMIANGELENPWPDN